MSHVINKVMTIFGAMNKEEKTELIQRIIEDDDVKKIVAQANGKDTEGVKNVRGSGTPKTKRKGAWKKGGRSPFYVKSITGVDNTKKGMFRAEGDFTNDYNTDLGVGEYVIVHQREPKNESDAYTLAVRNDSAKITINISGVDTDLVGLKKIYSDANANNVIDTYSSSYSPCRA